MVQDVYQGIPKIVLFLAFVFFKVLSWSMSYLERTYEYLLLIHYSTIVYEKN